MALSNSLTIIAKGIAQMSSWGLFQACASCGLKSKAVKVRGKPVSKVPRGPETCQVLSYEDREVK
jgi:hypothetical protein